MTLRTLVERNLRYFWRTHLAVVAGVGVAVGVLTGSLLVGDSVRGSLRELFLSRLGATDDAVVANTFFREDLARDLSTESAPLIAFEGMLSHEASGRRRTGVQVYGVDERFWTFHGATAPELSSRDVLVTAALADELGSTPGDTVLLRIERPSDVARGSLHGVKEDTGRTIRLQVLDGLESSGLPEFSMYPQQGDVFAVFVSLARLQRDLGQPSRVNTVLLSGDGGVERLRSSVRLEDLGVHVRELEPGRVLAVESDALMLSAPIVDAVYREAAEVGARTTSLMTYLANVMRVGDRELPYSLVSALNHDAVSDDGILLSEWAAADLDAREGDELHMEFYVWEDEGQIAERSERFVVEGVLPIEGLRPDKDMAPDYPGISETDNLSDWEPPFPIDLNRVRDKDEAYWDDYGATPKAFIGLARGQAIWPVRQGKLTSIRVVGDDVDATDFGNRVRARLDPLELGYVVIEAREEGVRASRGATDFGEYFVYFSYFLVVSALLLTGLFFKLGVEQRLREVGALLALGYTMRTVRKLFLAEGAVLAALGGALGTGIALAYGAIIMYGLRTWWVDAVGTELLSLHIRPVSLVAGIGGGALVAFLAIWLTLRYLQRIPPRSLLAGDSGAESGAEKQRVSRRALILGFLALAASVSFVALSALGIVPDAAGFFGAGGFLLAALLLFQWVWLKSDRRQLLPSVGRLGVRNATYKPGRSLVAIALIAFASFIIVAVDAFRKDDASVDLDLDSGTGGYALIGESLLPLHWDPNTLEGQDALNLPYPEDADAIPMFISTLRLKPGDDASCLNLYRPQNPRVLSVSRAFRDEGRFRFGSSLATTPEEEANPWRLLERTFPDGAIPVIGDANSMSYVLHLGLGEDFLLPRVGEAALRLRLVATLSDSIFQSELLMAEDRFLEHFPDVDGFRFFLVETEDTVGATELLERRLADLAADVTTTSSRLASFHRVENTYLSTFQSLGGLGLVLGTFGLAAVLLRNILERRRELALLRAVGYKGQDFMRMILAENALLLALGLLTGSVAAIVAIAPALVGRGAAGATSSSLGWLFLGIAVSALVSTMLAMKAVRRAPILESLRAE